MLSLSEKSPDWLGDLSRALRDEARVLEQLRDAMADQRAAVAANDNDALDISVRGIARTVHTLEEARKRRASVMRYLTGNEDLPLNQLGHFLGEPLPLELDAARAEVRLAAQGVAHEAAVNRVVLQRAREATDAFLQELFSAVARSDAVYGPGEPEEASEMPAMLLNRKA
jgi:hypothetical protein